MNKNIGFIGLGHMGLPMAKGLVNAGFTVTAFDISQSCLQAFSEYGGHATSDLKRLAKTSDVAITMLPSGKQLLDIYSLNGPLLNNLKPNTLLIDCSTVGTLAAKQWHTTVNDKGFRSVDAPVSGGVAAASNQSLTFMMGGKSSDIQNAQKILEHIGKQFIHTGGKSSGQTAKICNNLILANNMVALSEAFLLAERLGLEKDKFLAVVQNSSGNSWVVEKYLPIPNLKDNVPANHHYEPGFSTQMMTKDLGLVKACCEQLGIELDMIDTTLQLYSQMIELNFGDKDFSYVYPFIKEKLR